MEREGRPPGQLVAEGGPDGPKPGEAALADNAAQPVVFQRGAKGSGLALGAGEHLGQAATAW
ncbi:hypothetical protein QMK33_15250 [Hymenobacter sp. H14-R3]|uniref:hypothetical protein n=1 Tax=Hymenobacter sp. H14-R3 TaxID=3046308 RepID=UPI0024BAA349|nr:hypothetical protein [Hymenobacter sp. H14-R3]MDJ0366515.1 hypothetical protein [Hymenobacter sp. H14-R3]